jgi:hypothetical protein
MSKGGAELLSAERSLERTAARGPRYEFKELDANYLETGMKHINCGETIFKAV